MSLKIKKFISFNSKINYSELAGYATVQNIKTFDCAKKLQTLIHSEIIFVSPALLIQSSVAEN